MTTVVKLVERRVWPDDMVRIDRRTKWGNPFVIGRDGNRKQVIDKYKEWITSSRDAGPLRAAIRRGELFDKKLACHCYPLPCHGDVLAELSMKHGPTTRKCEGVGYFTETYGYVCDEEAEGGSRFCHECQAELTASVK